MSRIGRAPITVPAGVEVKAADGFVTVKGPKGELNQHISQNMTVDIKDGEIHVSRPNDEKENRALHGLTRKLIANMVTGVTEGYTKALEIVGVGYRASKNGNVLTLNVGYSHPVDMPDPEGITTEVENNTKIYVKGIDRQLVGQHAANIKKVRKPEPYKGKGIRYSGEYIRIKEGKTGKK